MSDAPNPYGEDLGALDALASLRDTPSTIIRIVDGLGTAGAALAAGLGLAATGAGADVGAATAGPIVAAAGGAGGELQAASKPLAAPPANTRSSRRRLKPKSVD